MDPQNLSSDERKVLEHRLEAAGLPQRAFELRFKDLPKTAIVDAVDYFTHPAYPEDLVKGTGFCLTGNPAVRRDVLMILAKERAFAGKGVFFMSGSQMQARITNDTDKRTAILRCDYLFLDMFEKDYVEENCCPYTFSERDDIETVLITRKDQGRVTLFSACRPWDQLRWWSGEFKSMLRNHIRDITITK